MHTYDVHICTLQMLAQVIDIHTQAATGEVRLLAPQRTQNQIAFHRLVDISAQDEQQVTFAGREMRLTDGLPY